MIATVVVSVVWSVVKPLLNYIPTIQINYDGISNSTVFQFLRAGMYFLPTDTVSTILSLVIALWVLRVVIAILHSLWAALPVV